MGRYNRASGVPFRNVALVVCVFAVGGIAADTPAEQLIAAGHWKRARALVEADAAAHPGRALNFYLLSQIRYAFGDHETPYALAEKAVELAPSVGKYHRQLAEVTGMVAEGANPVRLLILARRFHKEVDAAIALDPHDPLAVRDLMEYYLRAPGLVGGDVAKASELARRIAAIDPVNGYLAQARIARHRKDGAKAAATLDEGVRSLPNAYRLRVAAAEAFCDPATRDLAKAEVHARAAIAIDGTRMDAYAVVARILTLRKQWMELDTLLAAAEAAVPEDLTPCYRAAETLLETGTNLALAERLLRKYCASEPEGDAPSLAEAQAKLRRVTESARPKSAPR